MPTFITHTLCLWLLTASALSAQVATIKVRIEGAPKGTLVAIKEHVEPIEWTVNVVDSTTFDGSSDAVLRIDSARSIAYWINIGKHRIPLFVQPGTTLTIRGRWTDLDTLLQFEGDNAAGNRFLWHNSRTAHAALMKLTRNTLDVAPFKTLVDSLRDVSWQQYVDADTTQMPPIFREWARRIMMWDHVRALGYFRTWYDAKKNVSFSQAMPDEFVDEIRSLNVKDTLFAEDYGKVAAIRTFLDSYIPMSGSVQYNDASNIIDRLVGPDMEIQLAKSMLRYTIPNTQTQDREESAMETYRHHCQNPRYREIVERAYARARLLRPGSPAPSITATDNSGKEHGLAELTGTYAYILFSKPKCEMCQEQIAACKELRAALGDVVKVVVISTQGEDGTSKSAEIDPSTYDHHWFANAQQSATIERTFVRRGVFQTLLLDQDGKIITTSILAADVERTIRSRQR